MDMKQKNRYVSTFIVETRGSSLDHLCLSFTAPLTSESESDDYNSKHTQTHCTSLQLIYILLQTLFSRDVTEPANIHICRMRISCAKSVGFGCGFVVRSKLPAIMATVIQLIYLKLSSCKRTSSEQLK